MNIVAFLLVGLIATWTAGVIINNRNVGLLGDMIVGILGAFIGAYYSYNLIGEYYGFWGEMMISALFALSLLFITKLIGYGLKRVNRTSRLASKQ